MKFRRVFSILLALCMVLSMVPEQVLAAEHVVTAAACDHEYEVVEIYEPSCGEEGYTVYECIYCGDCYEDDFVDALEHSYVLVGTYEPSCEEEGYTEYECIYCGDCYEDDFVDALEHSYVMVGTYEPTCEDEGYTAYECSRCGDYYEDDFVDALGHAYQVTVYEPDCETEGYTEYVCDRCGDAYDDDHKERLGHSYENGNCIRCGKGEDFYIILTWGETPSDLDSHLVYSGAYGHGEVAYDRMEHRGPNGELVADLDEDDTTSYGPETVTVYRFEPGDSFRYYVHDFSNGGDSASEELGQSGATVTVYRGSTLLATYTVPTGIRGYIWEVFSYTSEGLEELEHEYQVIRVEATQCTEVGYYEYSCINCGDYYKVYDEEPLGHDLTHHEAQDASCTEIGWYAYDTCSRCDYTTYVEISATGHSYEAVVTDPTCTEQGYTTYTCSYCGDSYVDDYTDPVGHSGSMGTYCTVCNEYIPIIGTCGDLLWIIAEDGTMTISGQGAIPDYNTDTNVAPWFTKRTKITAVVIEDGVTGIGSYAFYACLKMESISIPDSIQKLGAGAFEACTKLKSVTIPEGVTSIGNSAFEGCSGLTQITIPEGVTSIGSSAFYNCSSLTAITIPEGVTSIGSSAFYNCSSLTAITIPEGVTSIGIYAFYNCSSLTAITIPEGITTIGNCAFYNCSSLTAITIPEGVTSIGSFVFRDCSSLTEITIPEGVTSIGSSAFFNCSSLTAITIPEGVTSIGGSAFSNCSSLTAITIPEGVTSIGGYAFYNCSSMTAITIPEGVTSIGEGTFFGCSSLTQITIPEGVTSIGSYAFKGCSSLTEIIFAGDAPTIDVRVFDYITLNAYYPVENTTWTEDVRQNYGGTITWVPYIAYGTCGTDAQWLLLTDGTLRIWGSGAMVDTYLDEFNVAHTPWYDYKDWITKVKIEEGIENVGNCAFAWCENLTAIEFSSTVSRIGDSAFRHCSSLIEITIPEGITSIGSEAFVYCSSLTQITIPEGVTSIGEYAFAECSSLAQITIPKGVTSIDSYMFAYCGSLTQITIPEGVTSIDDGVFQGCRSLTQITFPESVTSIGDWTFYGCSALEEVIFIGDAPKIDENAFSNVTLTAYYPMENTTWTEDVRQNYGGTITWEHYCLAHNYEDNVTAPTCTEEGYTTHTCRCGDSYIDSYVEPLGHDYGQWYVTVAVECLTDGEERHDCSRCDHYETRVVEKLGHDPIHHEAQDATCTEIGWYAYDTCSRCNYTTYVEIPATGHSHVAVVTDPTCTEQGYTTHTCHCGDSYIDSYVEPLGHDYGEWYVTVPVECLTDGQERHDCSRCDHFETRVVEKLGHDPIHHEAQDATCTEIGWYAYDTCSRCDYTTYVEIPATGHNYEAVVTDPTCTEQGYTTYTCSYCGDSYVDNYTDPVGHSGSMGTYCTVCNAYIPIVGTCGDLFWIIAEDGTMTISGQGAIPDYNTDTNVAPWFTKRTKITAVVIEDGVTSIGSYAFYACLKMERISIPDSIQKLGAGAFEACTKLKSVTIPEGVTSIGSFVFHDCSSLTQITIPEGVVSIGNYAFSGCSSMIEITIPEGVTVIDGSAFRDCSSLTEITIPEGVTSIGEAAFWACSSLTQIALPEGIVSIGNSAFSGCSSLTQIALPEGIVSIGSATFSGCSSLTAITIPEGLVSIGIFAFENCSSLIEITIPEGVVSIGNYAFSGCSSLREITIPESVTSIGYAAFRDYSSLTAITIPECITSIGGLAFSGCSNLMEVIFTGNAPTIEVDAFSNATLTAYYPVENTTWTENVRQNYGGTITWVPYCFVHNYEDIVTAPTCTEQGYTTHTCSACGDSYIDSYVEPLGHTVENGICCNCGDVFITITSDLEDTYVSSGKKATVTVEAEGEGLSYAWYYRDGSSGAFKLTTSFTGNSYSVTMNASRSGRQVYCVITDANGFSDQTATVTLGMKATIITQPKSASVKSKETITVSLEAAGDGLTYTWYYSDDGGLNFRKTTSFTGNSYSITMTSARAGRKVYCVVTDKFGNSVTSKTVTLGMRGTAAIRTQPVSVTVANGETAKVAVRASGTGLTYEWYYSDNGGLSFSKTTAFTGNSYSIKMTTSRAGRQVYCVVTDKNGNCVKSEVVTLGMTGKAAIRTQPVSVTVANGATAKVAVRASGIGLTYTWFYSDDGGKTFKVTTAFTGSTYSVTMNAKRAGRMVYCVITDANGNKVTTDVVTLNMG